MMPSTPFITLRLSRCCAGVHNAFIFSHTLLCRPCPGEFDAFNTIMAILRTRKKFPNLKPTEYYTKDKEFSDFVDCVPGEWLCMGSVQQAYGHMHGCAVLRCACASSSLAWVMVC
jgi:hypothetical protein